MDMSCRLQEWSQWTFRCRDGGSAGSSACAPVAWPAWEQASYEFDVKAAPAAPQGDTPVFDKEALYRKIDALDACEYADLVCMDAKASDTLEYRRMRCLAKMREIDEAEANCKPLEHVDQLQLGIQSARRWEKLDDHASSSSSN